MPKEWGGEYEIESVMSYRSGAGGIKVNGVYQPVTVSKLTGEPHGHGVRISTMDALQTAYRYCKPRGFRPKETIDCLTPDGAGVTRLLFKDRLCDGYVDCPNGEDENGDMVESMYKCPFFWRFANANFSTPHTTNPGKTLFLAPLLLKLFF